MKPIRSSSGLGRYTPSETDIVLGTYRTWTREQPLLVYCHGASDTALSAYAWPAQREIMRDLAQDFTVGVADLGGSTFGNDAGTASLAAFHAYLKASWGTGPLVLVGASMGALTAFNYLRTYPAEVVSLALVLPALDIADVYEAATAIDGSTVPGLIDAAYPPAYDDVVNGPTHSPIRFVGDLDPSLPIHLWAASDDTLTRPGPVAEFLATRPQTGFTDLGALGHTQEAIAAAAAGITNFVTGG